MVIRSNPSDITLAQLVACPFTLKALLLPLSPSPLPAVAGLGVLWTADAAPPPSGLAMVRGAVSVCLLGSLATSYRSTN